jgi:hypothetical protein
LTAIRVAKAQLAVPSGQALPTNIPSTTHSFRRGTKYEGRWYVADHDPPREDARVPDLAEVAGKRILLTCEQGHGDIFQFARYAPLLGRHGARVNLQVYVEQKALMQTMEGVETIVAMGEKEPPVDIVTPLLSLPLVFGTELDSIPAEVPYLRAPPPSSLSDLTTRGHPY